MTSSSEPWVSIFTKSNWRPAKQIVQPGFFDPLFHDNFVPEKRGVLAIERGAGRLQPFPAQEHLGEAGFVRRGNAMLLEAELAKIGQAEGIGFDQGRHAAGKHAEKFAREGADMRADIQHRPRACSPPSAALAERS